MAFQGKDIKYMDNTLFLGNGFSRSIFNNMPSWSDLFDGASNSINNNTILYEIARLNAGNNGDDENKVKTQIIDKINANFTSDNINRDVRYINCFGKFLSDNHVNNIITTNYDKGIEFILCQMCGYKEQTHDDIDAELVYSIRTYILFTNEELHHTVKLWKIHGDFDRIKSVTLGFDQYCGALSKLNDYVKGKYKSSKASNQRNTCSIPMKTKCSNQVFDDISWAELFFKTNIFIAGFGMDFSEIDIWWLLNKRARFMLEIPEIKNTISYLYDTKYETPETKSAIFDALHSFRVLCKPIKSDSNYIQRIFKHISTVTKEQES
jgi:hypothetical protein